MQHIFSRVRAHFSFGHPDKYSLVTSAGQPCNLGWTPPAVGWAACGPPHHSARRVVDRSRDGCGQGWPAVSGRKIPSQSLTTLNDGHLALGFYEAAAAASSRLLLPLLALRAWALISTARVARPSRIPSQAHCLKHRSGLSGALAARIDSRVQIAPWSRLGRGRSGDRPSKILLLPAGARWGVQAGVIGHLQLPDSRGARGPTHARAAPSKPPAGHRPSPRGAVLVPTAAGPRLPVRSLPIAVNRAAPFPVHGQPRCAHPSRISTSLRSGKKPAPGGGGAHHAPPPPPPRPPTRRMPSMASLRRWWPLSPPRAWWTAPPRRRRSVRCKQRPPPMRLRSLPPKRRCGR